MIAFRKAIRHYAVTTGFEFAPGLKTDKTRFIARCAAEGCPWRIHASRLQDDRTIPVIRSTTKFLFIFISFAMYFNLIASPVCIADKGFTI